MYIKMQVSISGTEYNYFVGQVIEIEDELAEKWISVGHAVKATNGQAEDALADADNKKITQQREDDAAVALKSAQAAEQAERKKKSKSGGVKDADIRHDADGQSAVGDSTGSDASQPPDPAGSGAADNGTGQTAPPS